MPLHSMMTLLYTFVGPIAPLIWPLILLSTLFLEQLKVDPLLEFLCGRSLYIRICRVSVLQDIN